MTDGNYTFTQRCTGNVQDLKCLKKWILIFTSEGFPFSFQPGDAQNVGLSVFFFPILLESFRHLGHIVTWGPHVHFPG